jgi:hypothetical protein
LEHPTPFTIGDTVTEHATFQGSELVTPTILRNMTGPIEAGSRPTIASRTIWRVCVPSNRSMRTHHGSPTG